MNDFAQYTDAARMKDIFAQCWLAAEPAELEITECLILHVWRKNYRKNPDRSFITILYQLKIAHRSTGHSTQQMLYVKAYTQNRSQLIFQQHIDQHLSTPKIGRALSHLSSLDMVVWAFPNDPAMPQLGALTHLNQAKQQLPIDTLSTDITSLHIEIVNYRPELRCTVRYELNCVINKKLATHILFGKTFATSQGEEVFARMLALWDWAQANPCAFRVARPLAHHQETNTIWQQGMPGKPLAQIIHWGNYRTMADNIVKGLINLHASKIPVSNCLMPDTHLAETSKKADKLEQAFPYLQAALTKIRYQLERDRPGYMKLHPIHGDFHVNQLLWSEGQIALFDFDEFALGDPLQDLANFMVDLYAQPFDAAFIIAMANALLTSYQQQSAQMFSSQRFNWHLRIQFLTRAYRCLWQQKPDLERSIRFYLQLAQGDFRQFAQVA